MEAPAQLDLGGPPRSEPSGRSAASWLSVIPGDVRAMRAPVAKRGPDDRTPTLSPCRLTTK